MGIKNLTEAEEKEFYRLVEKINRKEPDKEQDVKVKKPECGTRYYYLDGVGDIANTVWVGSEYDNVRWDLGNVFLTEKEIVFAIEKRKVEVELERYAKEHNNPHMHPTEYITLDTENKIIKDLSSLFNVPQGSIGFTSYAVFDDAVNVVGKDRILKYIFGVESEGE